MWVIFYTTALSPEHPYFVEKFDSEDTQEAVARYDMLSKSPFAVNPRIAQECDVDDLR